MWLLHTNDAYGSTAATAFAYAAATVLTESVAVSVSTEESSEEAQETSRASVEIKARCEFGIVRWCSMGVDG